jgi:hydrogenase nickel incorporation protein HypA/HybF
VHELALSQSVLDVVLDCARAERLRSISQVVLEVGTAAGVTASGLRSCFELVAEGTPAEGAELVVELVPIRVRCRQCGLEYEPEWSMPTFATRWTRSRQAICPSCGNTASEIVVGREVRIRSCTGEPQSAPPDGPAATRGQESARSR